MPQHNRSWKEELEAAGPSRGGGGGGGVDGVGSERGNGDGDGEEEASGTGEQSSSPDEAGGGGGGEKEEGENDKKVFFTPTAHQARVARHLGHRLELARTVAAGVREKISDLKQQLDAQAREVRTSVADDMNACTSVHIAPLPIPIFLFALSFFFLTLPRSHSLSPTLSLPLSLSLPFFLPR